jgi:glycoprotein endo-alpha-1,2-mannosidase
MKMKTARFLILCYTFCIVFGDSKIRRRKKAAIRGIDHATPRILKVEIPDRKEPSVVAKDTLKFAQADWRDNVFPEELTTPLPSDQPSDQPSQLPSSQPSSSSANTINKDTYIPGQLTMGVYYYPWHADDFHRGDGYIREDLIPPQQPLLGEYDDRDAGVVLQHLQWSRQAHVRLWVTSWWGPYTRTDNTTRNFILPHEGLQDHQISLFYETDGRILKNDNPLENVLSDVQYMCETYFDHPNYFRINDRPVLFIYLTRSLDGLGLLKDVVDLMRQGVQDACGQDVYLVGDQIYGAASDKDFTDPSRYEPFELLDAVTNYDVYGSIGSVVGRKGGSLAEEEVNRYYQVEQRLWRDAANSFNCKYVPAIAPGYNDVSVRSGNPPLSRSLTGKEPGSLLKLALENAIPLVDPDTQRLMMINSFNEWHEDTQIEPTIGGSTSLPTDITSGITYRGYGEQYLEILRVGTEDEM